MGVKLGGVTFDVAKERLLSAAQYLFKHDRRVRTLGIVRVDDGYAFRVSRNKNVIVPFNLKKPEDFDGVPLIHRSKDGDLRTFSCRIPMGDTTHEEQVRIRPVSLGQRIQNYDHDVRDGTNGKRLMSVGTLGAFVRRQDATFLLSNNHVLAGCNAAKAGDRITQPGCISPESVAKHQVATLDQFEPLIFSPASANPADGNVVFNQVDAGLALLLQDVPSEPGFLPSRGECPKLIGVAEPDDGMEVFKIGSTTGLTRGVIDEVESIVGPVPYDPHGQCWFSGVFSVKGVGGNFGDTGDSGALIVTKEGNAVGVLFGGMDDTVYGCKISDVLTKLDAKLILTNQEVHNCD
jgi:hypothetical protein